MTSKDAIEAKLLGSFPGRFVGAMPVPQFLDFLSEVDGRPVMPNVYSPENLVKISHTHFSDLSDFGALGILQQAVHLNAGAYGGVHQCLLRNTIPPLWIFRPPLWLLGTFLYWDRSGVVVSQRFQYTANLTPLTEFLWRLNHGSPGDRGVDVSVVPVSLSESQDSTVRELLGIGSSDPLYGYIVPVDTAKLKDAVGHPSSTTHHFYVGPRPAQKQCSLLEQRARGFHVWDLTQKRVIFFKETWRLDSPGISTESAVYRELHSRRISNIPTFEHGGDMSALGTQAITHSFSMAWWCCTPNHKAHLPLVQHHTILRDVERNLSTFKTPTEFLTIIKDALTGESLRVSLSLHGNISMEGIGITSEGRGLLMGWECCSLKSHDELLKIQMGNIPFMSGALLDHSTQDKRHVLADNLKSFLHVMMYTMARYLPYTIDVEKKNVLLQIFDEEYAIDIDKGRADHRWLAQEGMPC
ncbi:hypothetical protein EDD22DRAFT_955140 [Suillus occidentalis]|nr:hypothetical protein EDD22DRAFT_955140 [Suillus occidentalis]